MRSRRVAGLVLALALAAGTAACTGDGDDEPGPGQPSTSASSTPAIKPAKLTFGVYGEPGEIAAYQGAVDVYNTAHAEAKVKVKSYGSREDLLAALETGDDVPDLYLLNRVDLADVLAAKANQPVGDLMDARNVDLGDDFSRPASEAFAADRQLQCMPYGISPMVIYYNPALVDFSRMQARGLDVPNSVLADPVGKVGWNFAQFTAAAQFASRPRKGVAGFYVAPTLRGLAPYVYSAGGDVFDDDEAPTSLAFSSDDTRAALETVLPVLRDSRFTLTAQQLSEKTPLQWFQEGKLGMIAGFRSLTPQLRAVPGLAFDVLPMPVVDDAATVGDVTGICISSATREPDASADFLADFVSEGTVSAVAQGGYLSPANVQVALTDSFLQPGDQPSHASVFYDNERNVRIPPLVSDPSALEDSVAGSLQQLLSTDATEGADLTQLITQVTTQIDADSQSVLAAPESESPSPGATESSSD